MGGGEEEDGKGKMGKGRWEGEDGKGRLEREDGKEKMGRGRWERWERED